MLLNMIVNTNKLPKSHRLKFRENNGILLGLLVRASGIHGKYTTFNVYRVEINVISSSACLIKSRASIDQWIEAFDLACYEIPSNVPFTLIRTLRRRSWHVP